MHSLSEAQMVAQAINHRKATRQDGSGLQYPDRDVLLRMVEDFVQASDRLKEIDERLEIC